MAEILQLYMKKFFGTTSCFFSCLLVFVYRRKKGLFAQYQFVYESSFISHHFYMKLLSQIKASLV